MAEGSAEHVTEYPTINPPAGENWKQCFCCGRWYATPGTARFSILTTNAISRRICGDCVSAMWKARHWAEQNTNPTKRQSGKWGWSWLRR